MPPFQIGPAARAELAPNGTLRAAVNYGNAVLARRDADLGPVQKRRAAFAAD